MVAAVDIDDCDVLLVAVVEVEIVLEEDIDPVVGIVLEEDTALAEDTVPAAYAPVEDIDLVEDDFRAGFDVRFVEVVILQ